MSLRPRDAATTLSETRALRLRAAWLYHNQGLTQQQVAERLGIARTTVIRLLDEALKRNEVRIWIADDGIDELVALATGLEARYGLAHAVVVPSGEGAEGTARAVGLALGRYLSGAIADNQTIGVGWGRTLSASLSGIEPRRRESTRVVSLLGGLMHAGATNPPDYAWQLASQIGAECHLYTAPLIVDSPVTRDALISRCGLHVLHEMAGDLDLAVVSCGEVAPGSTSLSATLFGPDVLADLIARGGVADVMGQVIDTDGNSIAHPISGRVMSVELDTIATARQRVLASGGGQRVAAIRAALARLKAQVLITDEAAARGLLI
ncbi:MAG: sugar-binding transcriptional regulator [Devosia sp.]